MQRRTGLWAALVVSACALIGGWVALTHRQDSRLTPREQADQLIRMADDRGPTWGNRATKQYRRAVCLDPTYPHARVVLGRALVDAGDPVAAEREFREAVRLDPAYEFGYWGLADALERQGRLDEALRAHEQALPLVSPSGQGLAYADIARIHEKQGHRDLAIAAWRESARLIPEFPLSHERLAALLAEKGAHEKAARERELARKCAAEIDAPTSPGDARRSP